MKFVFLKIIGLASVKNKSKRNLDQISINPFLNFKIFNMFKNFTDVSNSDTEGTLSEALTILQIKAMPSDQLNKNIFKVIKEN